MYRIGAMNYMRSRHRLFVVISDLSTVRMTPRNGYYSEYAAEACSFRIKQWHEIANQHGNQYDVQPNAVVAHLVFEDMSHFSVFGLRAQSTFKALMF